VVRGRLKGERSILRWGGGAGGFGANGNFKIERKNFWAVNTQK